MNFSDILLNKNEIEPSVMDKKIDIKYMKDGKSHRTFVYNLEYYIPDKKVREQHIKKMQQQFGTSCAYKSTSFGNAYGFGGDFSAKIKEYLLSNTNGSIDNSNFTRNT